jgi:CheY-like chemotaxis protein
MAHEFDVHSFERLLDDAERLVAHAVEYEGRFSTLINDAEDRTAAVGDLPALRALCVAARQQRQLAETLLMRMIGDGVRIDGASPPRLRVLVVDDAPDNRQVAALSLEAAGFETITASNGLEGVIVAHYARPAVILMDVSMPVLDGLAAARLLKASAATRDLKMIAYTAAPDFYEGPFTKLFVGVLTKPVDPDAIVASVRQHALDTL